MAGLVPDELMLDVVKTELDRLRGKVSGLSWSRLKLTARAGSLTVSRGRCNKANSWIKCLRLRYARLPSRRLCLIAQDRPLNMIVHLNVPDSVIMARIAGECPYPPTRFCR